MPKKITTEIFIERAKKVHGDTYDYSKVIYDGMENKVCVICPKHGEFWTTPHNHLKPRGCLQCRKEYLRNKFSLGLDGFIERAQRKHFNQYLYDNVNYINAYEKVSIYCKRCNKYFLQTPHAHLSGEGCPNCRVERIYEARKFNETCSSSFIQIYLKNNLCNHFGNDDVEIEYSEDKRYPFHCDFYIKSKDLFIELNGHWTHNNHWFDESSTNDINILNEWQSKGTKFYSSAIKTWTVRDVKKRKYACKNNLNYVVFWGDCKSDIDDWFAEGCPIRKDWK